MSEKDTGNEERATPGPKGPHAPKDINERAKSVWRSVVATYDLEDWQLALLRRAVQIMTQVDQAQEALKNGLMDAEGMYIALPGSTTYLDRFGQPQIRPEVSIIRQGIAQEVQIFQKLYLDPPDEDEYV